MLSQLLLVLVSATTLVCGQWAVTIVPSTVPLSTRQSWCSSQTSSCPLLCLQMPGVSSAPLANNCSAQTLSYSCICSNNLSPNASQYSETIPYFVCTEHNNQCVDACASGDSTCQSDCRTQNPCGAQNPTRVNVTTTTTATTHATSASSAFVTNTLVGSATGAAPKLVSVEMGHVYGLCVLVAGFIAGFAALL
ncbi:hypothetical protein N7510_002464 [Penicillium lagena]|uniref:uncharacterized protein n=1 Tax=Penicillium lagena TaxID=94218 RepID=UPI0025401AF9|nr:uncharacterized protein N7510_002464 [Penicillium lagena]KAJ5626155.1 hypothetical protein N7510_002464 [Penicillium lagena]